MSRLDELRANCERFHTQHPEVWSLFCRFAFEKISPAGGGYRHFGAKAIMERVRWETAAGASRPQLKINDHYTAFYARRFGRLYPEHADFFRVRRQRSQDDPARQRGE